MLTFAQGHRLVVALVGPCGAGKSTLASALGQFPGFDIIKEEHPADLGEDKPYSALDVPAAQRQLLHSRLDQALAARSSILVFDRFVDEDLHVFFQLHYELGGLNDCHLPELTALAKHTYEVIGIPDVTVRVSAAAPILRSRIGNGERPAWLVESFDRQLELYSCLTANLEGLVLDVDTSSCSPHDMEAAAAWIVETISSPTLKTSNCVKNTRFRAWP